mgnify:FL=1
MIVVVAALIKKDNKILIARRSTGDENLLGKWEFPGGKVETGENEYQAIEREIKEEFELNIHAKSFLTNNVFQYPTKIVDLRLYSCEYVSGNFKLHDHSEYKYIDRNELLNYDLAPADIPLAQFVKEMC